MVEANIRKDRWDKFSIIANFVALALVPIVLGIYGSSINTTLKEKESIFDEQQKMTYF